MDLDDGTAAPASLGRSPDPLKQKGISIMMEMVDNLLRFVTLTALEAAIWCVVGIGLAVFGGAVAYGVWKLVRR